MASAVGTITKFQAAVSLAILSCEPKQKKVAVRFGGSCRGWRWVDVPTNTPIVLHNKSSTENEEEFMEALMGPTNETEEEAYELAVSPLILTEEQSSGKRCIVRVDARQEPPKPVLLTAPYNSGGMFELLLKWSLVKETSTPQDKDQMSSREFGDHSGESKCSNDPPRPLSSADGLINTGGKEKRKETVEGTTGKLLGKDDAACAVDIPTGEAKQKQRSSLSPQHQKDQTKQMLATPSIPTDNLPLRNILLTTVISVHRPDTAQKRMLEISLTFGHDENEPSSATLVRTTIAAHQGGVKIARMGSPLLFPLKKEVRIRCSIREAAANLQSSGRTAEGVPHLPGGEDYTEITGWKSEPSGKGMTRGESGRFLTGNSATLGECNLLMTHEVDDIDQWDSSHSRNTDVVWWKCHPYLDQVYTAQKTVQFSECQVELAFMRMPMTAYRAAYESHKVARRSGHRTVEVRVESVKLKAGGSGLEYIEPQNHLVQLWLSQPPIDSSGSVRGASPGARADVPRTKEDIVGCRHLLPAYSKSYLQSVFFPVRSPFAYLSCVLMTPQEEQERVVCGAVPISLVRPALWAPLTVDLKENGKVVGSTKLWYCFSDEQASPSESGEWSHNPRLSGPGQWCYALQVRLVSCRRLYQLAKACSGDPQVQALRLVITDMQNETAVSTSRVLECAELRRCCPQEKEEETTLSDTGLVFGRVLFSKVLQESELDGKIAAGEEVAACCITLRCQVLAFDSISKANIMESPRCIADGRVIVSTNAESSGSSTFDMQVTVDGMSNYTCTTAEPSGAPSPLPQFAILRMQGEIRRINCSQNDAVMCVQSLQVLFRHEQQRRRGRVVWTDSGPSEVYVCLWLCDGLSKGGLTKWKDALRHSHVLLLAPHKQGQQQVSLQCNEFVLSTNGCRAILCAAFVPKAWNDSGNDSRVRLAAWNSLRKLVRKLGRDEDEVGLQNLQATMRAVKYIEVDLTASAFAHASIVGTACINDELLFQLRAEWLAVPPGIGTTTAVSSDGVATFSSQRPYQPSPRLWALRIKFPTKPSKSYLTVHAAAMPVSYNEPSSSSPPVRPTAFRSRKRLGLAIARLAASSSVSYVVHPRCPGKGRGWVLFIFGDATSTRTRLTASVGRTVVENIVGDSLEAKSVTLARGVVVDCFHGSFLVDAAEERRRRLEAEREWRRHLQEDEPEKQPCPLIIPFTTPAIGADGGDPVIFRYHTLTRCGDDDVILIGARMASGKSAIFHYSLIANMWSVFTIGKSSERKQLKKKYISDRSASAESGGTDSIKNSSWTSTKLFTARYGHAALYCLASRRIYVYGGIGIGGVNPEAAVVAVRESTNDGKEIHFTTKHKSMKDGKRCLGFMQDIWSVNLLDNTIECIYSGKMQAEPAPTARWRHSMAKYNDTLIVVGGRTVPTTEQQAHITKLTEGEKERECKEDQEQLRPSQCYEGEEDLTLRDCGICSCTSLLVFDLNQRVWTTQKSSGAKPAPRFGHAAVMRGNSMFIFGGMTKQQQLLNDMYELQLSHNTWHHVLHNGSLTPPPSHLAAMEAITVGGTPCLVLVSGVTGKGSDTNGAAECGLETLRVFIFSEATQFWRKINFNCSPPPAPVGIALCDATPSTTRSYGQHQLPSRQRYFPPNKNTLCKLLVVGGMRADTKNRGNAYLADYGLERENLIRPIAPTLLNIARRTQGETPKTEHKRYSPTPTNAKKGSRAHSLQSKASAGRAASPSDTALLRGRSARKPHRRRPSKMDKRSFSAGPLSIEQQRILVERLYYRKPQLPEDNGAGISQGGRRGTKSVGKPELNPQPPTQQRASDAPVFRSYCARSRGSTTQPHTPRRGVGRVSGRTGSPSRNGATKAKAEAISGPCHDPPDTCAAPPKTPHPRSVQQGKRAHKKKVGATRAVRGSRDRSAATQPESSEHKRDKEKQPHEPHLGRHEGLQTPSAVTKGANGTAANEVQKLKDEITEATSAIATLTLSSSAPITDGTTTACAKYEAPLQSEESKVLTQSDEITSTTEVAAVIPSGDEGEKAKKNGSTTTMRGEMLARPSGVGSEELEITCAQESPQHVAGGVSVSRVVGVESTADSGTDGDDTQNPSPTTAVQSELAPLAAPNGSVPGTATPTVQGQTGTTAEAK